MLLWNVLICVFLFRNVVEMRERWVNPVFFLLQKQAKVCSFFKETVCSAKILAISHFSKHHLMVCFHVLECLHVAEYLHFLIWVTLMMSLYFLSSEIINHGLTRGKTFIYLFFIFPNDQLVKERKTQNLPMVFYHAGT